MYTVNNTNLNPVSTVFSTDSPLDIPQIVQAKQYLVKHCKSRYSLPIPHLTYSITPLKEEVFLKARDYILNVIKQIKPYTVRIGDLQIDKRYFLYLPVISDELFNLHKLFIEALDNFHTNEARGKDLIRLQEGKLTELEKKYLYEHGYYRILDNFKAHLTIGNISNSDCERKNVLRYLRNLLKEVVNKDFMVDTIHVVFHTDAKDQKDMKVIWEEDIRIG